MQTDVVQQVLRRPLPCARCERPMQLARLNSPPTCKGLRSLYTCMATALLIRRLPMPSGPPPAPGAHGVHRGRAYFDWSAVLASGEMSLFGDRQIVELRIPSGKPGKEGGAALQQLAGSRRPQRQRAGAALVLPPRKPLRLNAATRNPAPGSWPSTNLGVEGIPH